MTDILFRFNILLQVELCDEDEFMVLACDGIWYFYDFTSVFDSECCDVFGSNQLFTQLECIDGIFIQGPPLG